MAVTSFTSLPDDATFHILSFLEDEDLRVASSVSRYFRSSIDALCQERCRNERFIPESLPPKMNHRQFLLHRFPNAIGAGFFQEYLGEVGTVPPIPRNFIEMASPDFKLVFIPEYITITVDENSPLTLDETTGINGKKAQLIRDPEKGGDPTGRTRQIKVPVTPNNYIMLTQTCLKKNLPSLFKGIVDGRYPSPNVLDQKGNVGVGPSHWSYQKEALIGHCRPFHGKKGQLKMVNDKGLEVVPLGDRIVFHLSSHIKSGEIPNQTVPYSGCFERTATAVYDDSAELRQSALCWTPRTSREGPTFSLHIRDDIDDKYDWGVGAAVQVPAKKSSRTANCCVLS